MRTEMTQNNGNLPCICVSQEFFLVTIDRSLAKRNCINKNNQKLPILKFLVHYLADSKPNLAQDRQGNFMDKSLTRPNTRPYQLRTGGQGQKCAVSHFPTRAPLKFVKMIFNCTVFGKMKSMIPGNRRPTTVKPRKSVPANKAYLPKDMISKI